jgi:hypothetical protein
MRRFAIVIAIISVILGLVGILHPNFDYHRREEVAKIGPVSATIDKSQRVTIPIGSATALLVAGAAGLFIVLIRRPK